MKRYIYILAVLLASLASCSKEKGPGTVGAGEREVEMSFLVGSGATRAPSPSEDYIKDLTLLVFDGPGDAAQFQYSRNAWLKETGSDTYKTTLKLGSGLTIYFAANARDLLESLAGTVLVEGKTWGAIKDKLVLAASPQALGTTSGLPMWGMATGMTVADVPANNLGTVNLLRAVASTDITMSAANFSLAAGYVVFAADRGYLPYDPSNMKEVNGYKQMRSPLSPSGMKTDVDISYTVPSGQKNIENVFYMYENDTPLDGSSPVNRPTKVVLKGTWLDGPGVRTPTYYPLSIRDKNSNSGEYEKQQVTRNNKYTIIIQNVNGDGYENLGEAKEADDVNMDYEVIPWNDNEDGEIDIDGTKFFYRAASAVTLSREAGSAAEIVIRTNYEFGEIKMRFKGETDYVTLAVNSHDRFKAELLNKPNLEGEYYDCFRITTKQAFGSTPDDTAVLEVVAGRIKFNINIKQVDKNPSDWNDGGTVGWGK